MLAFNTDYLDLSGLWSERSEEMVDLWSSLPKPFPGSIPLNEKKDEPWRSTDK